jgi:hypothetical protein
MACRESLLERRFSVELTFIANQEKLCFFHGAQEWMLVLAGMGIYLLDLGFRHVLGKDPAYTYATRVNMQHHLRRFFFVHAEKHHQDLNDELHRSEIIIQQHDFVQRRTLDLGSGLLEG